MSQRRRRYLLLLLATTAAAAVAALLLCDHWVSSSAQGRLYSQADQVPAGRVALLLGCSQVLPDGRKNLFFSARIRAATTLWKAGKLRAIIVSGDNHTHGYDEPTDMKAALVAAGLPEAQIHCDYAGFRTLDSVLRAKTIFGQTQLTIISQPFHAERAIFQAQAHGIDAVGYCAADISATRALWTHLREWLARVSAVLDCWLLGTQPKFGGPPISI